MYHMYNKGAVIIYPDTTGWICLRVHMGSCIYTAAMLLMLVFSLNAPFRIGLCCFPACLCPSFVGPA